MKSFRLYALAAIAVGLAGAGHVTSAWAQPPVEPPPSTVRYQVIPYSHNSAIMIDSHTGQSWKLEKNAEENASFVWVPIRKLSTNMEIDEWLQRMKKFRSERKKRNAEFEGAIPLEIEPFGLLALPDLPLIDVANPKAAAPSAIGD